MVSDDEILSAFSDKPYFTRDDLTGFFTNCDSMVNENSFGWLIYDLNRRKVIRRLAHNVYQLSTDTNSAKAIYISDLSDDCATCQKLLQDKFPLMLFAVWETRAYNEFLNHQLSSNIIFVEAEKMLTESVFNTLREHIKTPVLYKPTSKEIDFYTGETTVIVLPLTSEAPVRDNIAELEKLLVDLFANKHISQIISLNEFSHIYEEAFKKYSINYKLMFRYAKRRGKYDEVAKFISDKTDITLIGKDI